MEAIRTSVVKKIVASMYGMILPKEEMLSRLR
jgi:hypothetical protein